MTDVKQHQMPLRHVIDNAEKAIQVATDAEMAVRHAQLDSNPQQLQSAIAQLETAKRNLEQAHSQIEAQDNEGLQELVQIKQQMENSMQSIEMVSLGTEQPKQIR
ncbi:hypothetical protein [Paenibacillus silviterrae]|uniref:hypothetical protein n=1 Tax=Paenibacillus silviterrae TaxID=3242194 RepID=UPI00254316F8|nr:hypothetical protein [Paenibacillus chinjuensis]